MAFYRLCLQRFPNLFKTILQIIFISNFTITDSNRKIKYPTFPSTTRYQVPKHPLTIIEIWCRLHQNQPTKKHKEKPKYPHNKHHKLLKLINFNPGRFLGDQAPAEAKKDEAAPTEPPKDAKQPTDNSKALSELEEKHIKQEKKLSENSDDKSEDSSSKDAESLEIRRRLLQHPLPNCLKCPSANRNLKSTKHPLLRSQLKSLIHNVITIYRAHKLHRDQIRKNSHPLIKQAILKQVKKKNNLRKKQQAAKTLQSHIKGMIQSEIESQQRQSREYKKINKIQEDYQISHNMSPKKVEDLENQEELENPEIIIMTKQLQDKKDKEGLTVTPLDVQNQIATYIHEKKLKKEIVTGEDVEQIIVQVKKNREESQKKQLQNKLQLEKAIQLNKIKSEQQKEMVKSKNEKEIEDAIVDRPSIIKEETEELNTIKSKIIDGKLSDEKSIKTELMKFVQNLQKKNMDKYSNTENFVKTKDKGIAELKKLIDEIMADKISSQKDVERETGKIVEIIKLDRQRIANKKAMEQEHLDIIKKELMASKLSKQTNFDKSDQKEGQKSLKELHKIKQEIQKEKEIQANLRTQKQFLMAWDQVDNEKLLIQNEMNKMVELKKIKQGILIEIKKSDDNKEKEFEKKISENKSEIEDEIDYGKFVMEHDANFKMMNYVKEVADKQIQNEKEKLKEEKDKLDRLERDMWRKRDMDEKVRKEELEKKLFREEEERRMKKEREEEERRMKKEREEEKAKKRKEEKEARMKKE